MRYPLLTALCLALPAALLARPAEAVDVTEIASAFDEGDAFDLFLGVSYSFEARRAAIKREASGTVVEDTVPDTVPVIRDLVFSEDRHTVTPHGKLGIFHDLFLTFALPIVISHNRSYEFDQRAEPCVFPGQGSPATCIDRTNSSTLVDGLLPDGSGGRLGYDASDPTTNFALDSTMVFRSVGRKGLDQLHLGIGWAPMNQDRDDTKPTWVLQAKFLISIGKIMRFDRLDPTSEAGVSRGVHEFRAETSVSKRTRWAEPFVSFWWQAPLGVRGDRPNDPDGSLYWDAGFGQRSNRTQQQAGTLFGFEAIVYDHKEKQQRLGLEFSGRVQAFFNGMGYSEMWEPFAYAGDVANNPEGPLVVDLDPVAVSDTAVSHPGVTTIENFMTFGARVGLNAQVGPNAKFGASFELGRDQTHAITYTGAGQELAGCGGGVSENCETPDDQVVTPGTREVNPLHKQVIDVAGRRYLVDETTTFTVLVNGQINF
jgi:hypothetical protein